MSGSRKMALGRGLGALLGAPTHVERAPAVADSKSIRPIALTSITPNPRQPRKHFSDDGMAELTESVRHHGVLQPILITPGDASGEYFLLAGERRFRAAQAAGLSEIPALVMEVSAEDMLAIAIVENVQREDLNVVEEARGYQALNRDFGWTQEEISLRVGKSRPAVANALRLLKLGDEALKDLETGRLSAGHARAILAVDDEFYRQRMRSEIVAKGLSVREAEKLALAYEKAGPPTRKGAKKNLSSSPQALDTVALEERLMAHLGCRARINSRDDQSGTVEFPFRNPDELDRLLQAINLPD
ncbi:ParB/RepB/Spo0J family partition protein [soil metagenome]